MTFSQAGRRDRILVVDDIYDNLLVVQAILEEQDYELILEPDSQRGLALAQAEPPDLLLLDVMMPGLDGYEFTRCLRRNSSLPFFPILLITAHDRSSVVQGLDAGADEFIRKPVDPDELEARVRCLLRLKHSIDERDSMAKLREDFASRLAHDLRTPLVAANRLLKLMREGRYFEVSSPLDQMIDSMIGSNQDLLQMVNNLVEIYRHEANYKNFDFVRFNLCELVQEVVQNLRVLAEDKGLRLELDAAEYTEIYVMGDRSELRRVFTNIIGNGIKFTEAGRVNVALSTDSTEVAIQIQDTGSGIAQSDRSQLFQRFRQGQHNLSESGLGLYLSRHILDAHEGKIEVESELGKGTTFTVKLPLSSLI
ncbi:sensor histidine kinase [Merismopedia glauca]|uniref:histidine kinase n=1 Tax=Merismopedia glauca CCAP 1448/3 TaxID=1296344 RepID=A0A2T1CAG2_9CYAN|nr:hybrid sensor histidine kinase/response regulator [Merismopedia glauca]PSB05234.1 hybrid sensor histidine kinase/response regulator [Merismopedia glauca CCAP 1448/3]